MNTTVKKEYFSFRTAQSFKCFLSMCLILIYSGCSKSSDSNNSSKAKASIALSMSVVKQNSIMTNLVNKKSNFKSLNKIKKANLFSVTNGNSVPAEGTGLTSFKIHINSIKICKSITLNGTAISDMSGCVTLYQGSSNAALDDTSNYSAQFTAAQASDDGYIDVMDATSLAKLAQTTSVTIDNIGDYNYGVIDISSPIKATATMVDPADGTTPVLYTKSTHAGTCQVNNNPVYSCAVSASSLTTAPAEESIFNGIIGGSMILKFQNPFTITEADINSNSSFNLKLAFNPNGLLQGVTANSSAGGATNFPPMTDNIINNGYNVGNTIELVGAQFAAVVMKNSGNVMRESYTATVNANGGGTYKLRIEFYYVDTDSTKTIYGVSTATLPTSNTSGYLIGWQRIYGVTTNTDGTINLLDYSGNSLITNFTRQSSVSGTTTATISCDVGMSCSAPTTQSLTFTLDALEIVN